MKRKIYLFSAGIIAIAIIGLGFAACDDDNGDAHTHSYGEWTETTAPTCTETGIRTRYCTICGEPDPNNVIPKIEHNWGAWAQTNAPTCTAAGSERRICSRDELHIENRDISALGHDGGWATYTSGIRTCQRGGGCSATVGIGDRGAAGGTIFYVKTEGFTVEGYTGTTGSFAEYTAYYMEAAPANESGYPQWGANETLIADVTTFTSSSDSKASLIGNGRKDTQIIVNHLATTSETGRAAQVCASKNLNSFTDWFLPSLGELNEMNKTKGQTGIPTTGLFWSSSQYVSSHAWGQNFSTGGPFRINKDSSYIYVCAVRAF